MTEQEAQDLDALRAADGFSVIDNESQPDPEVVRCPDKPKNRHRGGRYSRGTMPTYAKKPEVRIAFTAWPVSNLLAGAPESEADRENTELYPQSDAEPVDDEKLLELRGMTDKLSKAVKIVQGHEGKTKPPMKDPLVDASKRAVPIAPPADLTNLMGDATTNSTREAKQKAVAAQLFGLTKF